jgi:hypothetical protein
MDPIKVGTAVLSLAGKASEIGKKLYDFGKKIKDSDLKHQIDEIADEIRELKRAADELEDENRSLKEKLRSNSDAFEFHTPFQYEKAHPNQPLCVKCFTQGIVAQMGEPGQACDSNRRRCLNCGQLVRVGPYNFVPSPRITSDFPRRR